MIRTRLLGLYSGSRCIRTTPQLRPSNLSRRYFSLNALKLDDAPRKQKHVIRLVSQRQPIFTWKRLWRNALILGVVWYFWPFSIVFEVVDEESAEEEHQHHTPNKPEGGQTHAVPEEGEEGEEMGMIAIGEESPVWFIPFTPAKEIEPEYFTYESPEWQLFAEFSKDRDEHKMLLAALCQSIRELTSKNLPDFQTKIGDLDVKRGKHWLDISFPYGPPKQYEMAGLALYPEESAIAISVKTMDHTTYQRLKATTSPMTMFNTILETGKTAYNFAFTQEVPQNPQSNGYSIGPPTQQQAEEEQQRKVQDKNEASTDAAGFLQFFWSGSVIVLYSFLKSYRKQLAVIQRKDRSDPDRGSVRITGLVEVVGNKGAATVDIVVDYDIKNKAFKIIEIGLRNIKPRSQKPRQVDQ